MFWLTRQPICYLTDETFNECWCSFVVTLININPDRTYTAYTAYTAYTGFAIRWNTYSRFKHKSHGTCAQQRSKHT